MFACRVWYVFPKVNYDNKILTRVVKKFVVRWCGAVAWDATFNPECIKESLERERKIYAGVHKIAV